MKWLIAAVLVALTGAQPAWADAQVTGRVTNIRSYVGHSGMLIALNAPYQAGDGCTGQTWYILPDNSPRAALVQSMLLSALAGQQRISMTVRGDHENDPPVVHVTFTKQ